MNCTKLLFWKCGTRRRRSVLAKMFFILLSLIKYMSSGYVAAPVSLASLAKFTHPLVLKVQTALHRSSPAQVVSDLEQPSSGQIRRPESDASSSVSTQSSDLGSPLARTVSLSIGKNSLFLSRRVNRLKTHVTN